MALQVACSHHQGYNASVGGAERRGDVVSGIKAGAR